MFDKMGPSCNVAHWITVRSAWVWVCCSVVVKAGVRVRNRIVSLKSNRHRLYVALYMHIKVLYDL